MEDKGIVRKIEGNLAVVQITASSVECESCGMKKICHPSGSTREIYAVNRAGAGEGDKVVVYIPEGIGWFSVLINFTIPVLLLVLGIILGKLFFKTDLYSFLTGIGLIVAYFIILIPIDRKARSRRVIPYIKAIEEPAQG